MRAAGKFGAVLLLAILSAMAPGQSVPGSRPAGPEQTSPDPNAALYDFASMLDTPPVVRAGCISSYDRKGGNDDGFRGTYSSLHVLPDGQHVIVDLSGPGCLYTLWFTGYSDGARLPWGTIRFYLDEQTQAQAAMDVEALFRGDSPLFARPLVADSFTTTGGNVSYVPIPFSRRLVVTTQKRPTFYSAFYHLYPAGTPVASWDGRQDLADVLTAWRTAGNEPPLPSGTQWRRGRVAVAGTADRNAQPTELLNLTGPGCITALRLNPEQPLSPFALNNLWLRIWWDGQAQPAVDVPVGPFFGSGLGERSVRALAIGMSHSGSYYCYLPMPFESAARVALENRQYDSAGQVYFEIAISPYPQLGPWAGRRRFKAVYRQEHPTTPGIDYLIVDEPTGQGVYLGHCLIVQPYSPGNKQWWEGDLRIRVDGRRDPILNGTGHEDEFLGGWSSRWLMDPYSLPLHGLPAVDLFHERADAQWNGAISAYRFFAGGIPFRDGIRVSTEHGFANRITTNYASVAWYYWAPSPAIRQTDRLDIADEASLQAHSYAADGGEQTVVLRHLFDGDEGRPDPVPLAAAVRRGQRLERFTMELARNNEGVLVRRLYSQSTGRHRAALFVDGRPAGMMGTADDNRVDRWREEDVVLPPSLTAGKERITVEIRVAEGVWNSAAYTAAPIVPAH